MFWVNTILIASLENDIIFMLVYLVGKFGCLFLLVKLILINICVKYLWHIKTILLSPVLRAFFIVKFE